MRVTGNPLFFFVMARGLLHFSISSVARSTSLTCHKLFSTLLQDKVYELIPYIILDLIYLLYMHI